MLNSFLELLFEKFKNRSEKIVNLNKNSYDKKIIG